MSLLEVSNVTVHFGGHLALDNVTLDAEANQITGIIGPNGAGKTTLFNVIGGLLKPDRGDVRLDGHSIIRLPPYRRARLGLARTFQRLELFTLLTVRENVELATTGWRHHRHDPDPDEILALVGLTDVADLRADELSTGTARLLELARALATNPSVLLLDEPASGQDGGESEAFRGVLRQVARSGVSVLLVEHDVSLVMRTCHRVHVLDFGSVLAGGTPDEIQANQAVRDAYLGPTIVEAAT
jgi:branched-chain amino acid transport system ATP-binding protein